MGHPHGFFSLKSCGGNKFLWLSQRQSDNSQIFLYDTDGNVLQQVTSGTDFNVEQIEAVDEQKKVVYFTGTYAGFSPLEKHFFMVSLDRFEANRLTPEGGQHFIRIDHSLRTFICVSESVMMPPEVTLRCLHSGRQIASLFRPAVDERMDRLQLSPPEFRKIIGNDGTVMYGALYAPCRSKFGPGPYPTVVSVYGGPQVQYVSDRWSMTSDMRSQCLRAKGFLVWKLDNRGSARRGRAFEASVYRELGTRELEDQVGGVRCLIASGLADPARIGIIGWSFGGFMALTALSRASDVFKVAVAGAPVTSWQGYDTVRYRPPPRIISL